MNEQLFSRNTPLAQNLSSIDKGKIVERIVELMHKYPDTSVKVERNVRLAPIINKNGKKREIDILLTREVAGHTIQIAIECKNEKRPIDTPAIELFAKKLEHVGVPYGIYVSASGYTKDAVENAAIDGIKPFTLQDLTQEALYASVVDAFQSIIYLFCQVVVVYITTPSKIYTLLQMPFYDKNGEQCGALDDLIWQKWFSAELPLSLGGHELALVLPSHWNFVMGDEVIPVISMKAIVDVSGLFVGHSGKATGNAYSLVKASDNTVDRNLLHIEIDISESDYTEIWVYSEEELQKLLERSETVQLHNRIKIPRIIAAGIYWPPSERVQKRIDERMKAFEADEIPDPQSFNFQEMEGVSPRTAFEPIWDGYHLNIDEAKQ